MIHKGHGLCCLYINAQNMTLNSYFRKAKMISQEKGDLQNWNIETK